MTRRNLGFTIIELLVVIVIIGVLASITIVSYAGITQKAAAVSLQSDLINARSQLEIYKTENGQYPTANNCPPGTTEICLKSSFGNIFGSTYSTDGNNFSLQATTTNGGLTYSITDNSAPIKVTAQVITAIGSISGTTSDGSVLTAGTLTPSGATVSYQWQNATSAGGTYTDIPGATSITYTLTLSDVGKYMKVTATGTGSYSGTITSTATSVVTSPWIAGVSPLSANTYVYNQDSSPAQWQTSTTQCLSPQCTIIGYDDPYLSASNSVDFSNYPARNVCKSLGGRLPDVNELRNVMSGRASYGNNFTDSVYYWSATETAYFYYSNYNNANGVLTTSNANLLQTKTTARPFRCVRDV